MFGIPEFIVIFVIALFWIVPVCAAVWALVTLYRMRIEEQAMRTSLERIERLLQRS